MNNGILNWPYCDCQAKVYQVTRVGLFGLALLLQAGCSEPPATAEVTGMVSVDGQPAESGSIGFFPVDGKSSTTGAVIKAGRYTAKVQR